MLYVLQAAATAHGSSHAAVSMEGLQAATATPQPACCGLYAAVCKPWLPGAADHQAEPCLCHLLAVLLQMQAAEGDLPAAQTSLNKSADGHQGDAAAQQVRDPWPGMGAEVNACLGVLYDLTST